MIAVFAAAVIGLTSLYKEVVYNLNYASASYALRFEKEYQIKTYSLSAVAPEIVWDFGKPIPILEQTGDQISFPEEKQFGLMVDMKDSSIVKGLSTQFKIRKLYRINLHYKKSMKDRLVKDYYLFTKNLD